MADLQTAIDQASSWLLQHQEKNGAWIGEVDLNPGPTAQAVMLHAALNRPFPDNLKEKAKHYILRMQNPDGGWSPFFESASEVSLSAECYVALRLLGMKADSDPCRRAGERIKALGGIRQGNAWTHLYFAVLGILPWEAVYKTPIEILLLPDSFPISMRKLSYWVKVITVPMALLGHLGPGAPIAMAWALAEELGVDAKTFQVPQTNIFLKYIYPLRNYLTFGARAKQRAVDLAWEWIESFTEAHGDFGGNTCTAINVLLIYFRSGKTQDAKFEAGLEAFMGYAMEDANEWRLQTCQSHVWDTGLALMALPRETGARHKDAVHKAVSWLRDNQILDVYGEWASKVKAEPGGWCFGDRHRHYPVLDCTAVALLAQLRFDDGAIRQSNALRGIRWLLAMQHAGGGWSSYERYNGACWINKVFRFKDIDDALVDAPKADVSSKVIEALAAWRNQLPSEIEPALQKARDFLLSARKYNGLWSGNYGINYLYGTSFSCKALRAIDGTPTPDWAETAKAFFLNVQNTDGGWGECEKSYRDPHLAGRGPSSPVQTSWALLGLVACSPSPLNSAPEPMQSALRRGIEYLHSQQQPSGIWTDPWFLGTVFPGMVYFRYSYYAAYFPLMALNACRDVG